MNVSDFAFRNRTALLLVVAIAVLGGLAAYVRLPIAIFPELTIPRIVTIANWGDNPPDTVMVSVTKPVEQAIATVPHVKRIRSTTSRGESEITVDFDWGTDMFQAYSLLNARLARLKDKLPPDATTQSEIMDPSIFPILAYSLYSPTMSQEDLYDLAQYTIKPRLARINGLREIRVEATRMREYRVALDAHALQANGLAPSDVVDAIRRANLVTAVGQFDENYQRHLVLSANRLTSLADIGSVVITSKNRVPIHVRDIGTVEESHVPQNIIDVANGHEAVLISIIRQPTSNTVAIAQAVHREIAQMLPTLPRGVRIRPFYDQSVLVQESEGSVRDAVILGALLAGLVQIAFLGSLSSAGAVLLILPITVVATLLVLLPLGRSLNIMTLGALAVSLGLVIDDAVVVVEDMFRYLEQGLPRAQAIREAMRDITPAMIGSSATTLVVFFPLLFLVGITGNFFAPLALTMGIALTISLLLALFLAPILGLSLLRAPEPGPPRRFSLAGMTAAVIGPVERGYDRAIRVCLRHRTWVLLSLIPLLAVTLLVARSLKTGFMPEMDEGGFILDYTLPPGTSLTETDRVCNLIGEILLKTPDVSAFARHTGTQLGFHITSQNTGEFLVKLKPRSRRRPIETVMDSLRVTIGGTFPNVRVDFIQLLQDMLGDLAGSPSPVEVKIYGDDMRTLEPLAHRIGKLVAATPGVVDEFDGITQSGPDVLVAVDGDRAAQAGLTPEAVSSQVNTAMFGELATQVRRGERLVGVRVAYPAASLNSLESLRQMPIIAPDGHATPLSALASITASPGSTEVNRENQRLVVAVTAGISGTDLGSAVHAIQAKVAKLRLPPSVSIDYGGLYASQQESFANLGMVLVVVALLTLCVLVFYFKSLKEAVALLAAGVLSLSGVVVGLWVTGTPLNISSFTGAIMVIGIVVEGSLFLLDSARQQMPSSSTVDEALISAGNLRLRPILMTRITAMLTLFPLALGLGAGAEMQKPLAIAVIGGVLFSGFFTLFVTPTLYAAFRPRLVLAVDGLETTDSGPGSHDAAASPGNAP